MGSSNERNQPPCVHLSVAGRKPVRELPFRHLRYLEKKRCRMHGGAAGSGAPVGNQNALRHGMDSRDTLEFKKHMRKLLRDGQDAIENR